MKDKHTADNKKQRFPDPTNADRQDMDKAPGEERGKQEKVTPADLKGKKVDADPEEEQRNDRRPHTAHDDGH